MINIRIFIIRPEIYIAAYVLIFTFKGRKDVIYEKKNILS